MAATGLLNDKEVTTHWNLVDKFREYYPNIALNPKKILIKDHNIITAGGMIAWLDLALVVINQLSSPKIARQLGKLLVIDTGQREQCYYQQFIPKLNHNDATILSAQKVIHSRYKDTIKISDLAKTHHLTERTFLRRFTKATAIKPSEYLQRFRIQTACDLLENTNSSFEIIANVVDYENVSACRKAFIKIMGLTPKKFRQRFVNIE